MTRMVVAGAILVPLIFMIPAADSFRLPKEAAVRGLAILLGAVAALGFLNGRLNLRATMRDRVVWMAMAVVGWTAVTAMTSTNVRLSASSLGWVAAGAVVFAAAYASAANASIHLAAVALVPAIINAGIVMLQTRGIWLVVRGPNIENAVARTALVGNPTDLGSYIVVPALAALALAIVTSGAVRMAYAVVSAILVVPIIVTTRVTPAGAYVISVLCLFLIWKLRAGMVAACVVLACGIVVLAIYEPLRGRTTAIINDVRNGNYDAALTYRTTAYLSAWRMGKEHPLFGVGPGCFGWQYYGYKLGVERDHPELLESLTRYLNFGEAHNDHVQTFAVAGIPGYLLFLGALGMLGSGSFRRPRKEREIEPDLRLRFAQIFSLPLAVSFFVVALTFFPLSLGVTVVTYAFFGGIVMQWSQL